MSEVKSKRFRATLGAFLIALLVAGCSGQFSQIDLKAANKFCADKGGFYNYEDNLGSYGDWVYCKNGEYINIHEIGN